MAIYQLSNYLFVCEDAGFGPGCERTQVIEQQRSYFEAAKEARDQGWLASMDAWSDDNRWDVLCPNCNAEREGHLAKLLARNDAPEAASAT